MTYATQQNMIDRFGNPEVIQITDHSNTGAIDATVLGQALADADAEIDGFLASRYVLPLTSEPPVLMRLACDIARYYLYDDRATDQVKERYQNARDFLTSIAQGKITLGVDASVAVVSEGPEVSAPTRVFTTDTLADY